MPLVIFILASVNIAIGTQCFVFSGLLAELATELGVSIGTAGQLPPASAITFAVVSPFAMSVLASFERRRVVLAGLAVLALSNLLCAIATTFSLLFGLRVLGGLATACVGSLATASVAAFVEPAKRGRAFAVVVGGMTVALAIGAPLGSVVGGSFGWRATFAYGGVVCALCVLLIALGMPRVPPDPSPSISAGAVLRDPAALRIFALTTLGFASTFTIVSFLGPIIYALTALQGAAVGGLQDFIGLGSLVGLALGGLLGDSKRRHLGLLLSFSAAAVTALCFAFMLRQPPSAAPYIVVGLLLLISAVALFGAIPLNLSRLSALAGPATPVALATNGSLVSLGQGLGAIWGGVISDVAG
jgi:MFS transporter, DHA1 family, inner membrane transport protein